MARPTYLEIDLGAFEQNIQTVRRYAPKSKIIAMVKANAYGHGLARVVTKMTSVDAFGVCCIEEALAIREVETEKPVILMEGVFTADELQHAVEKQFDIVVHHKQQIDMLATFETQKPIQVWLKINTGMNRLGIPPELTLRYWDALKSMPSVNENIRLMTHFAVADEVEKASTSEQIKVFKNATESLSAERSLANSAAVMAHPVSHADWVRPGIMLYGISPFSEEIGSSQGLKPAMRVVSELMAIQHCHKGDAIAYGGTWVCPEDMPVGVIAIGYGDGYPRHATPGTPVWVGGKKVPLIGRVSMDMLTVDLRDHPDAQIGDKVILWGPENPIETVAKHAGTIAYELACNITNRLPRVYK